MKFKSQEGVMETAEWHIEELEALVAPSKKGYDYYQ